MIEKYLSKIEDKIKEVIKEETKSSINEILPTIFKYAGFGLLFISFLPKHEKKTRSVQQTINLYFF